jgi:hypothetical protein
VEILTMMAVKTQFEQRELRIQPRRARARLIAWSFTLLACAHWGAAPEGIAQEALSEYQVKAAYLFNFLKFVEWPGDAFPDALAPIVIGIVGDDPFGSALPEVVTGKTVQGRDLVIRRYHAGENFRGASILFISASEKKRLPQILAGLRGGGVLTVSDMEGFLASGGMIQFLSENDRVRFGIDVTATSQARLKVSSKLLSLARVVTGVEKSSIY